MSDLDLDLKLELEDLEYEIQVAKSRLPDYSNRHFNTQRENSLIYCLRRAIELSEGCVICTKANLLAPLYVLTRGLLEGLIWVCWITKSSENAQTFIESANNEFKRIARKNLEDGYARVVDNVTNENKTQELLHSDWVKDIRPRLRIEEVAEKVGLEKLYTQTYGHLSIFAHGIILKTNANVKKDTFRILALAKVLTECINHVVKNWIVDRKQSPVKDIYAILK